MPFFKHHPLMPDHHDDEEDVLTERRAPEPISLNEALYLVRNGTDADLRKALVLVRSHVLSLPAVRTALILRAREALQVPTLPLDRVEVLSSALAALRVGEEVEFPFYLEEGLVTVTVPFSERF